MKLKLIFCDLLKSGRARKWKTLSSDPDIRVRDPTCFTSFIVVIKMFTKLSKNVDVSQYNLMPLLIKAIYCIELYIFVLIFTFIGLKYDEYSKKESLLFRFSVDLKLIQNFKKIYSKYI